MPKVKIPISERTFIRSLTAKKDEHIIKIVTQPYSIGMYVSIEDSQINRHIQLNLEHKKFPKWIKKLVDKLTNEGYSIETSELKYVDFVSEQDCIDYSVC